MRRPAAIYLLEPDAYDRIYGPAERADIESKVEMIVPPQTAQSIAQDPTPLSHVEVIFSGWGLPVLDEVFLAAAPELKAVFYGAGSIRRMVTDVFWNRGILITSAYAANAVPVMEFTLSQILYALKRGWHFVRAMREQQAWIERDPVPGAYGSSVGLISLGMIGSGVARLLQQFDLYVIAHDPYVTPERAAALQVEMVSLDEVFQRADVVSLHTPWLDETVGMIRSEHFRSMKPKATFINTARGAIVQEQEMIQVLQKRPDLWAILDVTYPEPPQPGSPLFSLPNVVLTPHIAGSMDTECRRMGRLMVEELGRYLVQKPLQWSITREQAAIMA